jgi:hypothetical protein
MRSPMLAFRSLSDRPLGSRPRRQDGERCRGPAIGLLRCRRHDQGSAGRRLRKFNSVAFDKALEPVGGSVKGAVGEEAVANARQTVSDAFSAALKGKSAVPDPQFVSAARGPLERLAAIKRNDLGPEIVQQIEESTKDLFDPKTGTLSGENMQSFLEALRQIRQSYKGDPLYARTIKPSVQGIENAVDGYVRPPGSRSRSRVQCR